MQKIDPIIKREITPLIEYSLDFAKLILADSGEFYPFGGTIKSNRETMTPVSYYTGVEYPKPDELVKGLDSSFEKDFEKKEIIASCTTYDVRIDNPKNDEKTDAICIKVRHVDMNDTIYFFYPYKLTDKQELIFDEAWATS